MRRLIILLALLCAMATPALSTDVTVAANITTLPGFQPSSLPADVSLSGLSVTNSSTTVTCSACLRAAWVGIGGFQITILGTRYTIDSIASTSSFTLTSAYLGSTSASATATLWKYVLLRFYADRYFIPLGANYVVQPGAPGSGAFFLQVACSLINNGSDTLLYIPETVLPATTDSPLPINTARFTGAFYRPDGSLIHYYACFESFRIPPTTPTTWVALCQYNTSGVIVPPNTDPVPRSELDGRLPSCDAGEGVYYKTTGNVLTCLTFGSGLTINTTTDTLTSSGGSFSLTVKEIDGSPSVSDVTTIRFSNGILTNDGSGQVTLATTPTFVDVDDTNVTLTVSSASNTHTFTMGWTGVLAVARGGTGLSSYTTGDMIYASAGTTLAKLGIGSSGQCLVVSGGLPAWGSCTSGTVAGSGTNPELAYWVTSGTLGSTTSVRFPASATIQLGVASSATGNLILANASGSTTTTLRAGNAATSLAYVWPATDPTAGQFLSASAPSGSVVTLSWAAGALTGSGSACNVAYFTSSTVLAGENALCWDATNDRLGIGTASPSRQLHISNATSSIMWLEDTGAGANQRKKFIMSDDGNLHLGEASDAGSDAAMMTIDTNGKVGINISSSIGATLDVRDTTVTGTTTTAQIVGPSPHDTNIPALTVIRYNNDQTTAQSMAVFNQRITSGPSNVGFGQRLLFLLQSTGAADVDAASMAVFWTTATHLSQTSAVRFETVNSGGSLTERMRVNFWGVQLSAVTHTNLGSPSNGTLTYCSDCQVTGAGDNTCASGGSGALALRLNSVWRCFAAQN